MTQSTYSIQLHAHRFAAWAASRAAGVQACRFKVGEGRAMLEMAGFTADLASPNNLPAAGAIDEEHRKWRTAVISAGNCIDKSLTDGVAAKLINVYLKARFVCIEHATHPRVAVLHPPIDRLLLRAMAKADFAGEGRRWKLAENRGWSNFSSGEYEQLIEAIRTGLNGAPFWTIEQFWQGHQ